MRNLEKLNDRVAEYAKKNFKNDFEEYEKKYRQKDEFEEQIKEYKSRRDSKLKE